MRMRHVLILSIDPLYENLAGPGIRAAEMARHLALACQVTLAAPEQADLKLPGVRCVAFDRDDAELIARLAEQAEIIVLQGYYLRRYPFLAQLDRVVVVDLYDPFHLENLQLHSRCAPEEASRRADDDRVVLNELLVAGDFFICASERQRDLWLGALGGLGRLSPELYARDPAFRSLIDVVPFGLDPRPPQRQRPVLKGVVPGIHPDDRVVLWGGGIWDWLDPLTVIRAMAYLREQRSDLKLFFLGHRHPNAGDVPEMLMYDRAVELAQELGLYQQTVFFNQRWVPYAERADFLLEADVGVSAHLEHVETRFAFRTRLLDYIWAGLPMVVSAGDTLAEVVARQRLGHVVPIGDAQGFAQAILRVVGQPDARASYAPAFASARAAFAWPLVLGPLLDFCRDPRPSRSRRADRAAELGGESLARRVDELEAEILKKNQHIADLEDLLKRIESGRIIRLLKLLDRRHS